jgi:hypothetical protein
MEAEADAAVERIAGLSNCTYILLFSVASVSSLTRRSILIPLLPSYAQWLQDEQVACKATPDERAAGGCGLS